MKNKIIYLMITLSNIVFADNLSLFVEDGKYGYKNNNGKIIINPQYDKAYKFLYNGLAAVKKDKRWAYIDKTGKVIYQANHDNDWNFLEDKELLPFLFNKKYGFIDTNGNIVIEPKFEEAGHFAYNGLTFIKMGGKYGFIDKTGKIAIKPKYEFAHDFTNNGLAQVTKNKKTGFINSKGEIVIDFKNISYMAGFSNNGLTIALTMYEEKYVDEKENDIIKLNSKNIGLGGSFTDNGLATIVNRDGKYGYINEKGDVVIKPQFDLVSYFSGNGFAVVSKIKSTNNSEYVYGFVDTRGNITLKTGVEKMHEFSNNGLARVKIKGKWGYMDEKGKIVIKPQFKWAGEFSNNNLAVVRIKDKEGYINKKGNIVINPIYDRAGQFENNGFAWVATDDKSAYINEKGEYIFRQTTECGFDVLKNKDDKIVYPVSGYKKTLIEKCSSFINLF